MLVLFIIVVVALVAWALRLMEQAIQSQEFSFMLAGFLVASSAAAMVAVYILMSHYMVYMDQVVSFAPSEVTTYYSDVGTYYEPADTYYSRTVIYPQAITVSKVPAVGAQ